MSDTSPKPSTPPEETTLIVAHSLFVRHRNALLVRAKFEPLYVDYYLHLMDNGLKYPPQPDQMLKDAIAAVVLHATTRPWKEHHAWTLNFAEPVMNLFVTASSLGENVVGRIFTEGVRQSDTSLFYAQTKVQDEEARTSTVEVQGKNIFGTVEDFYLQSEQRRARIFDLGDEEIIMVSAQPECDEEWLEGLTVQTAKTLSEDEELGPLETRRFRYQCGCNLERVFPAIAPLARQGLDELFLGDETITITCPRCAAKWRLTREQVEAVMSEPG